MRKKLIGYAFISPVYLILTLVLLVPLIYVIITSFQGDYGEFVGSRNYLQLFQERLFWVVLKNMLLWVFLSLVGQFIVGLGAALLLNQNIKGEKIFTSILLLPWISALVVSTITWRWMLDSEYGIINYLLMKFGLIHTNVVWLSNVKTAIYVLIFVNIWHLFPFAMITFSAALKSISSEIKDSAKIEGANAWQNLIYITIPHLMGLISIVTLYTIIWSFNAFTIPYLMTGGGPSNSTKVMALYVHQLVFGQLNFGLASSLSIVMAVVAVTVSYFYLKAIRRMGGI